MRQPQQVLSGRQVVPSTQEFLPREKHPRPKFDLIHNSHSYFFSDGEWLPEVSVLPRMPGVQGYNGSINNRVGAYAANGKNLITFESLPTEFVNKYIRLHTVLNPDTRSTHDHYEFAWNQYIKVGNSVRKEVDTNLRKEFYRDLLTYKIVPPIDEYTAQDLIALQRHQLNQLQKNRSKMHSPTPQILQDIEDLEKLIADMEASLDPKPRSKKKDT